MRERDRDGHRESERGAAHDLVCVVPLVLAFPAMSIAAFVVLASPSQKASARRLSARAWVSHPQAIAIMKISGRIHAIAQTARSITRVSVVGSQ